MNVVGSLLDFSPCTRTVICCEVLLYTPDAWIKEGATKIGYEVSATLHSLRTPDEIRPDIIALEKNPEGLIAEITGSDANGTSE